MKKFVNSWNKKLLFLLVALILLLIFVFVVLDVYFESGLTEARRVDAVVVLGAKQINGQPSPVFKARLDRAYELYMSGLAPIVILTGGVGSGDNISESEAGKNYLVTKGISASAIMTETTSRTTWQSLNNILPIIEANNIESMLLVSDDFHSKRLKRMAGDLSLMALVAPITDGPIQQDFYVEFRYIVRESIVYVLYLIFKI